MLEVISFYASYPLAVVCDFCPWLDQSVEDNISVEVDDADTSKPIALFCQDSFTVQGKYLCFPNSSESYLKFTYFPRLLP